jgi:hypothetical protein
VPGLSNRKDFGVVTRDVPIERARDDAHAHRLAADDGRGLAQERRQQAAKATTFKQAVDTFFDNKRMELEGSGHLMRWTSEMRDYVFPEVGGKPVSEVTHANVIEVLEPIWYEKPEMAKRVLQWMTPRLQVGDPAGPEAVRLPCVNIALRLREMAGSD